MDNLAETIKFLKGGGPGSGRKPYGNKAIADKRAHKMLLKHGWKNTSNDEPSYNKMSFYDHPKHGSLSIYKEPGQNFYFLHEDKDVDGYHHSELKQHLESLK